MAIVVALSAGIFLGWVTLIILFQVIIRLDKKKWRGQ